MMNEWVFYFQDMDELMAANRANGNCWFSEGTMNFWKTRISNNCLYAGRYFITSDRWYDKSRVWHVREALPSGAIKNAHEDYFKTRAQAFSYMRSILPQEMRKLVR
jgi:hypothetical protein